MACRQCSADEEELCAVADGNASSDDYPRNTAVQLKLQPINLPISDVWLKVVRSYTRLCKATSWPHAAKALQTCM